MVKTVLAFGSFDVLHPGHVHYLSKAKALGDRLIVVVARDESIRIIKHSDPFMGQSARVSLVGALRVVDRAVLGKKIRKKSDTFTIIKAFKPDIIALGYDQKVDVNGLKRWLASNRLRAKVVRLHTKLNDDIYKSSKIKKRILKR